LGNPGYIFAGRVGTAKTSVTLPLLSADNPTSSWSWPRWTPEPTWSPPPYRAKFPWLFAASSPLPLPSIPAPLLRFDARRT